MSTHTVGRTPVVPDAAITDSRPPLSPPAGRPGLHSFGASFGAYQLERGRAIGIVSIAGLDALEGKRDSFARVIADRASLGLPVSPYLIETYLDIRDRINGFHLTYRELSAERHQV